MDNESFHLYDMAMHLQLSSGIMREREREKERIVIECLNYITIWVLE